MNLSYQYPFPPQNYIAEEILLGTILIHPSMLVYISPLIKAEYFFLECHQIIYIHILSIYKKNKLYPLELLYHLSDTNHLYAIGGIYKIINIMKQSQIFITSINKNIYIEEIIEIIHLNYIKRLMIQYGHNIIQLAYIKKLSHYKLYNKASTYLDITEKKIPQKNINNFQDLIKDLLLDIQYPEESILKEARNSIHHLQCGFKKIDELIIGLNNGDLIVIAGRPSMGKTSLAINFACRIVNKNNIGLCFFSLEMSRQQILYKFIAILSHIPIQNIISNKLNYNQWKIIQNICEKLLNNYIYINEKTDISIDYIEYTSKILKKENPNIYLIIIDYLQLISTENLYNKNRVQQLAYITRKLKLLAQYLKVPIIILSQLNRSIEHRNNNKPILSDLKESGCIYTQHNISLNDNNLNSINIKKFITYNNKNIIIKYFNQNNFNSISISINNIPIYLLIEHIFHLNSLKSIFLTYNHRCLTIRQWITMASMIDSETILFKKSLKKNSLYILSNIKKIKSYTYSMTFDIYMNHFFYFILNEQAIVHNSIEQDADVVMMLYKQEREEKNLNQYITIDISISKNRNGPTGSCELYFSPQDTSFHNQIQNQ